MAKLMDKVTLVRNIQHTMKNHNSAGYYSLAGFALPVMINDCAAELPPRLAPSSTGSPRPPRSADRFLSCHSRRFHHAGPTCQFPGPLHNPLFINRDRTRPISAAGTVAPKD
jgi:hypothetical protein